MKLQEIGLIVLVVIVTSYMTKLALAKTQEPFQSLPGVPDILNHLAIDNSNVVRDDNDPIKVQLKPSFVVSGLKNGLTVNKMIGIHGSPSNRNMLRITNGADARNNACWGIDYTGDNTLLFRHYPLGFHPQSMTTDDELTHYYSLWDWFLRIFPSTQTRYGYPPIF